jgi:hypothetical protein
MKFILATLLTLALNSETFAMQIENWDRPLYISTEVAAISMKGDFSDLQNLSFLLTRNDSSANKGLAMNLDQETLFVSLEELVVPGCGVVVKGGSIVNELGEVIYVQVKDHTQRLCDNKTANFWEVYIAKTDSQGAVVGELELVVKVTPVITIQGGLQPSFEASAQDIEQDLTVVRITR